MLVLTRKVGERLLIGDDIEIVTTQVDGNKVRLGIIAPRDVVILREEVAEQDTEVLATSSAE